MPTLLMQDISTLGMFQGPDFAKYSRPTGIQVSSLADWHRVIDWWFMTYGRFAVAAKSQNAYSRDIDYEKVPPEKVEGVFKKIMTGQPVSPEDKKALEDHLFWVTTDRATMADLPVKLHTGYYVGHDYMPLSRLASNPDSAAALCRLSPDTRFVFMHICYPFYEPMIALAKHYTNAYLDMCWAWIINPVAAKDFLKKFLVTAPSNKIFTFGGDYYPVEPVLGHATLARHGIALTLSELVEEGWLSLPNAMDLIDPIMHENARRHGLSQRKSQTEHGGDGTGEDVSGARCGHPRVAAGVDIHPSVGQAHQGVGPLQHHPRPELLRHPLEDPDGVLQDLGDRHVGEARHLPGMGCEDGGGRPALDHPCILGHGR